MALPSLAYLVTNISIAPVCPAVTTVFVVLVPGMFDASSGIFLIFKLLSESYTLQEMFTVLTMGSVIVHLRTFFLMPYHSVPKDTKTPFFLSRYHFVR